MVYLLNIDTTLESAYLRLTLDGQLIASSANHQQKDHASWIHTAIEALLNSKELTISDLSGIAVVEGPGSYTGLRVGMATAKGICYAANKPLITMNTLVTLAGSVLSLQENLAANTLIAPMIDARRMEVFTAVYNQQLQPIMSPQALILDDTSYVSLLENNPILFCGNGATKWKEKFPHPNATYFLESLQPNYMDQYSFQKFNASAFANLAYSEPVYLKEFYTHPS
jgi:tRNA threonylcarbamoyladenosine biosynthesis protein TsaB